MPKKPANTREQVGARLDSDARASLEALQAHYAARAGVAKMSQSDALEIGLRELAQKYKLNGRK
jgi:hypothetical protein